MPLHSASALASSAGPLLARLGRFEVRLAHTEAEMRAAFRLRYEVFFRERGALAASLDHVDHIETDAFDPFCDHIVVIDTKARTPDGAPAVVGTYRALKAPVSGLGHFADAQFDLAALTARHPHLRMCELGRSCVAPAWRSRRTIEALWCGLWVYACANAIDVFIGAASFPGTDPSAHALPLGALHQAAPLSPRWSAPVKGDGIDMAPLGAETIDRHAALRAMPPLVRAYLRLNARFHTRAVVDPAFGTTDVLVVAPLADAPKAYRDRMARVTGAIHPGCV